MIHNPNQIDRHCIDCKDRVAYPEIEGVKFDIICEGCCEGLCPGCSDAGTINGVLYHILCKACRRDK